MTKPIVALIVISAFVIQPAGYAPIPFGPIDEAVTDPTLSRFRSELTEIVERRALEDLMRIVEPTASMQTRGSNAETFLRDFVDSGDELWPILRRVLALGGTFTTSRGAVVGRREFCAPYVYSAFPVTLPEWIGGETYPWAITGRNVAVRKAPTVASPVVARLSYVLVEYKSQQDNSVNPTDPPRPNMFQPTWIQVAITPERFGWVHGALIRSPQDWHVCMARIGNRWLISEFVRGEFDLSR